MHVARDVPPGYRVCQVYAGVRVLILMALSYHHNMSKVDEDDDHDDYGGGRHYSLKWIIHSDENPKNPRCFDRAVGSM